MFYSVYVLTKKGFLAPIWTEGTTKNKLSKKQIISTNITDMCNNVIQPKCGPLALRLTAVLLLGIARIHNRQCRYLLSDTNDVFGRVRFQSHPQAVNLPNENTFLRQERIDLPSDTHHLQQTLIELNMTTTQIGLDPILDSLDMTDGQLIVGEEGLEGMLVGMATPVSDIPAVSDITLHRLTDEGTDLLNTQLQQLAQEEYQDIDFGDIITMNDEQPQLQSQSSLIVLTPPKYVSYKRSLPIIKPDSRIELSDDIWKRQRLDVSYMVMKRPPLPSIENDGMTSSYMIIPPTYQDDIVDFLQYHTSIDRSLEEDKLNREPIERRRGTESDMLGFNENNMDIDISNVDFESLEGEFPDGDTVPLVETTVGTNDSNLIPMALSTPSSSSSTPSYQNTVRLLSMLEDAGLKDHSISFDTFTQQKKRGFVTKSFYSLLVLATENHVMLNQQECFGDIEISDVTC